MPSLKLLILGFVAGFLATLIFHQGLWSVFNHAEIISWDRPAWPVDPIPPLGVPALLSKAFWGGVWGLVLTLILGRLGGASYWLAWIVVGAVALTVVSFFRCIAAERPAHPSAVAALLCRAGIEWRLGLWHRAPAVGPCGRGSP